MIWDGKTIEHYPSYCNLIHSSVYYDLEQIHLPYRDMYEENGVIFPSDGDMWERIAQISKEQNLKCYAIREVTCIHENENY
jgi:hypothetical protein